MSTSPLESVAPRPLSPAASSSSRHHTTTNVMMPSAAAESTAATPLSSASHQLQTHAHPMSSVTALSSPGAVQPYDPEVGGGFASSVSLSEVPTPHAARILSAEQSQQQQLQHGATVPSAWLNSVRARQQELQRQQERHAAWRRRQEERRGAAHNIVAPVHAMLIGLSHDSTELSRLHSSAISNPVVSADETNRSVGCQTLRNDDDVVHSKAPLLSPFLSVLFYLNNALHLFTYAAYVRRRNVDTVIAGIYFFFSMLGLLTLPGIAWCFFLTTVLKNQTRTRRRRLRFLGCAVASATSAVPLLLCDVVIYHEKGIVNGWQGCALISSLCTAVVVPWMIYLEFAVEAMQEYGGKYVMRKYQHLFSYPVAARARMMGNFRMFDDEEMAPLPTAQGGGDGASTVPSTPQEGTSAPPTPFYREHTSPAEIM